jgi:hypothetical protein
VKNQFKAITDQLPINRNKKFIIGFLDVIPPASGFSIAILEPAFNNVINKK